MSTRKEFWAISRKQGRPTTNPTALDIDVILAAQAFALFDPQVIIQIASTPAHDAESTTTKTIYLSPEQIVKAAADREVTHAAVPEEVGEDKTPAAVSRIQDWD